MYVSDYRAIFHPNQQVRKVRQANTRPPQDAVQRLFHLHPTRHVHQHAVLRQRTCQGSKLAFIRPHDLPENFFQNLGVLFFCRAQVGENHTFGCQISSQGCLGSAAGQ